MISRVAGGLLAAVSLASAAALIPDNGLYGAESCSQIILKDIVIIGGGASGAHAAVQLREDHNKSIVVVEKQGELGGHVDTYIDPKSGLPYDFGVNSFTDYGAARQFFARMNVPVQAPTRLALATTYADFSTGLKVNFSAVAPTITATNAALTKFLELATEYQQYIEPSYVNFPAPADIPEDLLLPFRDFVAKYSLQAAVPRIYGVTGLGMGNMLDALTMYVFQAFGAPIAGSFVGNVTGFVPVSKRNQEIYDNIGKLLGGDVLYNSTVIQALRTGEGVELLVQNSQTKAVTLILAKKLLITIEPTPENMAPFKLDCVENNVFAGLNYSTVFAGIVSHPSLPVNGSLTNQLTSSATDASPGNWMDLPSSPFVGRFDYMGGDNWRLLVTGTQDFTICNAVTLANRALNKMAAAGTIPPTNGQRLKIKAIQNHGAMHQRRSAGAIRGGAIQRQLDVQGHLSTFWGGATFSAQFTTILWEYNLQYLIPKLLASF